MIRRYLTISQAAEAIGLPGSTPGAKAQLLRRLEARGVVPPAKRSSLSNERYYTEEDVEWLQSRIGAWRRSNGG